MGSDSESRPSSEYDTDKEKAQKGAKPKKRKMYKQMFCNSWLSHAQFKSWIKKKSVDGSDVPFCVVCNVKISCAKTAIKRHGASKSHETAMNRSVEEANSQPSARAFLGPSSSAVAKMEIKICSFLAENNLPISLCEEMLPFLRSLHPTDSVLKKVSLGKQKATNTIRQVLGLHFLRESVELLQKNKFSLIIDETTDQSTVSQLALLGTFFDKEKFEMVCVFIGLVELSDGKADTIYQSVKDCLNEMSIPVENLIGFCADTCNVMFGKHHSVSQLLIKDHPWILPVKCSCHLIHLCASKASLKLPKSLEDLCRNIYSHFNLSSQRIDAFHEFQDFFDVHKHKILKAGNTRWLSMKMCVDRVLEQYEPLKLYFTEAGLQDPTNVHDSVMRSLNNHFTRAYLEFLAFNLGRLTAFNTLFQSSVPLLHLLRREITNLVGGMCSDFMKAEYIRGRAVENIDVGNEEHYVPLDKVYIGLAATSTIQSIARDIGHDYPDIMTFYAHCRDFLRECVRQILSRFDSIGQFDFLSCLSPEVVQNLTLPSLFPLFERLPYLKDEVDVQQADLEWRQLSLNSSISGNVNPNVFWQSVFQTKNQAGNSLYPQLCKVVSILFSLPYSNAAVERVFSQLKLIKNDHRASLKKESLLGLITTKLAFQRKGKGQATALDPPSCMVRLHSKMKANADDSSCASIRKLFLTEMKQKKQK